MRVGGAAEAAVVLLSPVEHVVPALVAGQRPVRDLVVGQTGRGEQLVDQLVLVGLVVVVGMTVRLRGQRRAGLDRERVGGHVGRVELDDRLDRAAPVVDRLPRRAVDQVEVERRQVRPGGSPRPRPPRCRWSCVRPSAPSTCVAIDCTPRLTRLTPWATYASQQLVGDVVGVALDRDLGVVGDRHESRSRRRAPSPSTIDGVPPPTKMLVAGGMPSSIARLDVGAERTEVGVGQVVAVGPGRERAVVALRRAERDVDVDAEGRRRGGHRVSESTQAARNTRSSASSRRAT